MDTNTSDQLAELTTQASTLARTITDQANAEEAAYQRGLHDAAQLYRTIFDHGVDTGRAQAEHEIHQAWAHLAARIRHTANNPTHLQLEDRRTEPGNLWRYARGEDPQPDHYTTTYLRRGGDYTGGPTPWNPQPDPDPTVTSDPWATLPRTTA